jgi:hypothetical protein
LMARLNSRVSETNTKSQCLNARNKQNRFKIWLKKPIYNFVLVISVMWPVLRYRPRIWNFPILRVFSIYHRQHSPCNYQPCWIDVVILNIAKFLNQLAETVI